MSYTTISCVIVRCDDCARPLEFDTEDTAQYATEVEAAAAAVSCGWLAADRFHCCELCAEDRTRRGDPVGGAD